MEPTVDNIIHRSRDYVKGIGTRHNKKLHRSCAPEVYELVDPGRKSDPPPQHKTQDMPLFDTSGRQQRKFKSRVNNQRLLKALEGQLDLDLVPLVEKSENAEQWLWRETQRTKMYLDRVASNAEERMIQI